MAWARILAGVGRTLIGAGLLVLAFVAYQLWGTGLHESRAQDSLASEFDDVLTAADTLGVTDQTPAPNPTPTPTPTPTSTPPPATAPPQGPPATTAPPSTAFDDGAVAQRWTPEQLAYFFPEDGEAMARLELPTIGVDKIVVAGVEVDDLRRGPGHYTGTPFPGQPGNAAIAGHRTTYGAPFHDLDRLQVGDEIVVTTVQGTFTYEVMPSGTAFPEVDQGTDAAAAHTIVSPRDVWVLDDRGDDRLTLTACHPRYSARERIVVVAGLVGRPAPAPPVPTEEQPVVVADPETGVTAELADEYVEQAAAGIDLDEGLGWSTDELPGAIAWGVVAGALALAAWVAGRHWRRWPSYALGALPVLVALWFCFERVDRFLPAV